MHSLTLGEIARLTGGTLHGAGDIIITSISTDTRDIMPGALFGAIVGQRSDGHEFVNDALTSGAVAVLCTRVVDAPCVVVDGVGQIDPVIAALGAIAAHERAQLHDLNVIGITGSSGKTSTKDLIGQVLSAAAATYCPAGSPNNELGLPLTILNAPHATKNLVLEMGMRGLGHIQYLCEIAKPTIAVVTNVGTAHIGEVGSQLGIANAKAELVESLPADGIAILNADDNYVSAMAQRTSARKFTFGIQNPADVQAVDIDIAEDGTTSFLVKANDEEIKLTLPLIGIHNVSNSLAAIAVGLQVGMSLSQCAAALAKAELKSKWRMERTDLARGIVLINDAYNANPESMKAAITALASFKSGEQTWLVAGGMHELGKNEHEMHLEIGQFARVAGIKNVIVIGQLAKPIADGFGQSAVWVPDQNVAADYIEKNISDNSVVLVKASRSESLEVLAQELVSRIGRVRA